MKPKNALFLLLGATCSPALLGCSSSGTGGTSMLGVTSAALRRMQSCEDLTQALREDARSKMNRRIDAQIRAIREGYSSYGYGYAEDSAGFATGTSTGSGGPTAVVPGASGNAAVPAHSETETQVKGVDEADIVKADGTRLYVLHGQKFVVVDAWPAPGLALGGATDIEGDPTEMFVANGKAVIFSIASGTSLYTAAGISPRPGYSDAYASPVYGDFVGGPAVGGIAAPGYGGNGTADPLMKVTVLALDGPQPSVVRELYFEGSYLSSRRVASEVRFVLEGGAHGPALDYNPSFVSDTSGVSNQSPSTDDQIAAWEVVRAKNDAAIAGSTYGDWLPIGFTKDSSGVHAGPIACGDFYVPTAGSTEFGMTQVLAINLDAPTEPARGVGIVGAAETVYGNTSSMVLAGRAYVDPWTVRQSQVPSGVYMGVAPPVETMNFTHLHLFNLGSGPSGPVYVGSGTVPGDVKDQFALDEKSGQVRVTTTEQRSGPPLSDGRQNEVSHVYVLQSNADHLVITGDAGEIAPGEQLYATRYVGDKAYVVTWHVTDPLFVVDLADPTHPTVLGELKISGFSEYMHPLDDTHLLTIGRETDDTGHQHTEGGFWYGIAIQIFDVTNPLNPLLQQKYVYDGGEYATTEATENHKAFTYFDDRALLAFPYVRQNFGASTMSGPSSTLEVFHVDVATGINKVGSVDHSSLLKTLPNGNYGYCGGYFDGAVRRGVFFESVVYSISYGGIMANDVSNLATPISSLKLGAPTMQNVTCQ
jgi:Beta propeller domain